MNHRSPRVNREQIKDMDEAVAAVKRCWNPMPGPSEIEIRPVFEMADFGEALTPELAEAAVGAAAGEGGG